MVCSLSGGAIVSTLGRCSKPTRLIPAHTNSKRINPGCRATTAMMPRSAEPMRLTHRYDGDSRDQRPLAFAQKASKINAAPSNCIPFESAEFMQQVYTRGVGLGRYLNLREAGRFQSAHQQDRNVVAAPSGICWWRSCVLMRKSSSRFPAHCSLPHRHFDVACYYWPVARIPARCAHYRIAKEARADVPVHTVP